MTPETPLQTPSTPTELPTPNGSDTLQLGDHHPLARVLGSYKDDPMLDAVMEEIYKARRRDQAEVEAEYQAELAAEGAKDK